MDINKRVSDFRSNLIVALATKFHYLIFFGAIAGLTLALVIGRPDYAIRGLIYIVPGILVAILLLIIYRTDGKYPDILIMSQATRKVFYIFFVSLFTLSLLALYFSPYRPWYYFLLITGLFCVIFLQIFSENLKPSILLFEISCVMGNIIFGLQLKYPFYFGYTDIIPHLFYSKIVSLSGHILPADLDISYAWFPLYHIFIAEGTNLLGIDVKFAFIILTSLSFIVVLWVIYLLFYQVTKNPQTSLLICLFFSTTPVVITFSTYVVTRVMAFIGFFFFLFLAHKQVHSPKLRSLSVLLLAFSIYLILVHQVSILEILFLLFLFILIEIIINDYFAIKTKIIIFIILTASTYWIFTSISFVRDIILERSSLGETPGISTLKTQIAGYEYIFLENHISTSISIFFVILGVGYIFWAYRSKYPSVLGLFVLITCLVYFPSPLTASNLTMQTFGLDRLSLLISPFFAFASAIGFLLLLNIFYRNKSTQKIVFVFGLLIFSYLCFSALTGENATDSPDLSVNQSRVYFTESEMNSFNFISQFVRSNSTISGDTFSGRMFERKFFSETAALGLPSYYSAYTLESTTPFTFNEGFFIFREQELERNGLNFRTKNSDLAQDLYDIKYEPTQDSFLVFSNLTDRSQKIYDNRNVGILAN